MNVCLPTLASFCPYIQNTDVTALRIHPVVPANTREAVRDTCLPRGGGQDGQAPLFIKAGTTLSLSAYSLHRRKDVFGEDVEIFRPERWDHIQPKWVYLSPIHYLSHSLT